MKKRFLSILTALCLCLTLLPTAVLAEDGRLAEPDEALAASNGTDVAYLTLTGNFVIKSQHKTLEDAISAAMKLADSENANVDIIIDETVETLSVTGTPEICSAHKITLDLQGCAVSGTISVGSTDGTQTGTLVIKDNTTFGGSGSIEKVTVHSGSRLTLNGTLQTSVGTISHDADAIITLLSGNIGAISSGTPNYTSYLGTERAYYAYDSGTKGSILTIAEVKARLQNDEAVAVAPCEHSKGTLSGRDFTCAYCSKEIKNNDVVLTETDGTMTLYTAGKLRDALSDAQSRSGCTVELLTDIKSGTPFTITSGSFTLDLAGCNLTVTNDAALTIKGNTTNVAICNSATSQQASVKATGNYAKAVRVDGGAHVELGSATGGTILFTAQSPVAALATEVRAAELRDGTLTIFNGEFTGMSAGVYVAFSGSSTATPPTLVIHGGKFSATEATGSGLYATNGGTISLSGGAYNKISTNGDVFSYLADGSTFSTANSGTGVIDRTNPGEALNGTVYVVPHTHDFSTNAKCACGLSCPHAGVDESTGICSDCHQRAGSVKLTKGSTVTFYNSLSAAVSEAAKYGNAGSTVTLLTDFADLDSDNQLTLGWHSDVTLDLNGKKLDMSGVLFNLVGADGKLTVVNTAATRAEVKVIGAFYFGQTGTSVTIGRPDGSESNIDFISRTLVGFKENKQNPYQMTLTIYGGEYYGGSFVLDIETVGATVNIHGGKLSFSNGGGIYLKGGGKLSLFGGEFGEIWNYDCPYLDLLADGCAFADADGNVVDATSYDFFNKSCKVVSGHTHQNRPGMDGKCACGYVCPHTNISATGHCDACGGDFPAELTTDGKTTHHETMEHALNAAASGSTIRLINTTMLGSVNYTLADKAVMIDLNGQNLTGGLVGNPANTGATLQISGSGAVIFTGAGSVQPYIHLDKNLAADNQTAFLGGTFSSILQSSDNTTVLPTLAQANGFALRNADGSWLSLSGLAAEELQNVTASAVPVAVVTMPEDASQVYGDKALPADLTKLTICVAKDFSATVTWKTGERVLSAKTWNSGGEYAYPALSYTGDPLGKGEYPLTCVITAVDKTGKTFTAYETVAPKLTVAAANAEIKTAPKAVPELTYDTTAHALVTPGAAEHGTLQYALLESGPYSADVPIATGAGTYEVWYKIVPDKNYAAPAAQFVEVRIASATLTVTALDKQITAGQPAPDLANPIPGEDYKVDGLLGQDTLAAVTLTYNETPDTSRAGSYTINISATLANYDIMTIPGTLTIVPRRSASGGSTTYPVNTPSKVANGTVTVSPKNASKGDTVTVTVKSDSGYVLETISVTDKNGNNLKLTDKGNGKYTFTMPGSKVEIKVTFMEDNSVLNFFYDVPNDAYYYEAVKWAAENGITGGVGNSLFAPNQPCTRAQIVTFLWRAAGSPVVNYLMPFTDVDEGAYYAEAVRWAASTGIVTGLTETTFGTNDVCTRAQAATMIYRYAQAQGKGFTGAWMFLLPFTDVPEWAYESVAWCYMNGVTTGVNETAFAPGNDCTRAQIVTFLWRAFSK